MNNAVFLVFLRYLHIVSAIMLVGGAVYYITCLLPAVRDLSADLRTSVLGRAQQRFRGILWFSILGLLVSGGINWMLSNKYYGTPLAQALIGTKVLLSLIIFVIFAARDMGLLPPKPKLWAMINLHLAAVVILLAAILRYVRLESITAP